LFQQLGSHRVADELLHRATVGLDDRLHLLEVARQQRPQRLWISLLSSAVEPVRSQKRTVNVLRTSRGAGVVASGAPQALQKRASPAFSCPQLAQMGTSGC
jgi:hypothetical protein